MDMKLRIGDRVKVKNGRHIGEKGTVTFPIRSGVEVELDEFGWTYQFADDLELVLAV